MGRLIDTNILIEAERGRLDIDSHVSDHETEMFYISVISVSELLHGVHRANDLVVKGRRAASSERFISMFTVIPIDTEVARTHAALWATLGAAGQMIGIHDLWLAATCLTHGLGVVTHNLREFERIPGLVVETW
jgi:tRNA(fMet)-specific endonuclease VapC